MSDNSFNLIEESSSSSSHTYKAHLKHDGNRSHLHSDFHTQLQNISVSHAQYRKKKYTIGSATDMLKEDFEEILRFFEKRSTQEVYEDCMHLLRDDEDVETTLPECRTNYHYSSLQRDFLIRFWLFHMGVEDHVVNAMLVRDNTVSGGGPGDTFSSTSLQNLTTLDAGGVVGLSRVERFHRLLDAGALGNRVGKHFIPQTKEGTVFWSENFTLAYNTVFTEPLRPVTTSALSRLLSERMHLLQLPRQRREMAYGSGGCSISGDERGGGASGGGGTCDARGSRGPQGLAGVLNRVLLAPPVPGSDLMTAVASISPHHLAPLPATVQCSVSTIVSEEGKEGRGGDGAGSVEAVISPSADRVTDQGNRLLEHSPLEVTSVQVGVIPGDKSEISSSGSDKFRDTDTDTDSDSDSESDSDGDGPEEGKSHSSGAHTASGI